jgi:hypothetical protein
MPSVLMVFARENARGTSVSRTPGRWLLMIVLVNGLLVQGLIVDLLIGDLLIVDLLIGDLLMVDQLMGRWAEGKMAVRR